LFLEIGRMVIGKLKKFMPEISLYNTPGARIKFKVSAIGFSGGLPAAEIRITDLNYGGIMGIPNVINATCREVIWNYGECPHNS
jgi:hypothetical protein